MVSITVSAVKKTPLARDLPVTLDFPGKSVNSVTIADVKHAFAAKHPKVSHLAFIHSIYIILRDTTVVLHITSKTLHQRR